MKSQTKVFIRNIIEQLIEQGLLAREPEFQTLFITDSGHNLFSGRADFRLVKPITRQKKKQVAKKDKIRAAAEWENIDRRLFETLRAKRRQLAAEKNVPAYIIFGDKTLRDMAAVKPVCRDDFSTVFGVGQAKLNQYAEIFIKVIKEYQANEGQVSTLD